MPLLIALSILLSLADRVQAQDTTPAQAVRAAVAQQLLQREGVDARTRFVGDSAELESYLRCAPHPAGRACQLADSLPVMLVDVRMIGTDSAAVTVGRYRLFTTRCPGNQPLDPPQVAIDAFETRTMVFRDARWVEVGPRSVAVC